MATLYISEFKNLPFCDNGVMQCPDAAEWVSDQTIAVGGASTPSSAFNAATRYVLLSADVVCSIAWTLPSDGSVRAATATNMRLPASTPRPYGVQPGMKVSAITNT